MDAEVEFTAVGHHRDVHGHPSARPHWVARFDSATREEEVDRAAPQVRRCEIDGPGLSAEEPNERSSGDSGGERGQHVGGVDRRFGPHVVDRVVHGVEVVGRRTVDHRYQDATRCETVRGEVAPVPGAHRHGHAQLVDRLGELAMELPERTGHGRDEDVVHTRTVSLPGAVDRIEVEPERVIATSERPYRKHLRATSIGDQHLAAE